MLGCVGVDVDEGPAQPGQLARPQAAHQSGQPHRRLGSAGMASTRRRCACSMVSYLRGFAGRAAGQQHLGGRVRLDHVRWRTAVLARLVEVVPVAVDRAGRVPLPRHGGEQLLEALGRRSGRPAGRRSPAARVRRAAGGRWRWCSATSPGRGGTSWSGEAFGQPASNQASITSPNVAEALPTGRRCDEPGRAGRSSSSRSRWASAFSTRSTLRREPSGNRTHAIHRCGRSFHRTVGRSPCHQQPPRRRSQPPKGYAQTGYVARIRGSGRD